MKKTILMILAVFSMGTLVAQNNPPATNPSTGTRSTTPATQQSTPQSTQQTTQTPPNVNTRFNTDYPNMKSTWSMSGTNYRAEYIDPTNKMGRAVIYDREGNPVGMEKEIGKGEYPGTINEYYSSKYPNEQYRVWTTDDINGKRSYFITRKSDVVWFDDKGTYTRSNPANHNSNTK